MLIVQAIWLASIRSVEILVQELVAKTQNVVSSATRPLAIAYKATPVIHSVSAQWFNKLLQRESTHAFPVHAEPMQSAENKTEQGLVSVSKITSATLTKDVAQNASSALTVHRTRLV
jgi:hypothetical protein